MVQGVKRMIDFISRPLLKSDSIYREIRAVNSEHQMNKNQDDFKFKISKTLYL